MNDCLRCGERCTDDDVVFAGLRICDACVTVDDLRRLLQTQREWCRFFEDRLAAAERDRDLFGLTVIDNERST